MVVVVAAKRPFFFFTFLCSAFLFFLHYLLLWLDSSHLRLLCDWWPIHQNAVKEIEKGYYIRRKRYRFEKKVTRCIVSYRISSSYSHRSCFCWRSASHSKSYNPFTSLLFFYVRWRRWKKTGMLSYTDSLFPLIFFPFLCYYY